MLRGAGEGWWGLMGLGHDGVGLSMEIWEINRGQSGTEGAASEVSGALHKKGSEVHFGAIVECLRDSWQYKVQFCL